jgi:KaiC/GvpD/RAD55 family RecA-like ATPase
MLAQPDDDDDPGFGAPPPAVPALRVLGADERVSTRWTQALDRVNKGKARPLSLASPLSTLDAVMGRRDLPPMPWPATMPDLARRCRTNPGDVTSIIGGTGSGKTQFAIEIACAFAAAGRGCVIWAPLEIQPPDLSIRIAANRSRTHMMEIRDSWPRERIAPILASVTDRWQYLDQLTTAADLDAQLVEIDQAVELATQIYGAAPLLVVDYIQLLADTEDQRAATTAAVRGLERITVRRGCYTIELSQTSRSNSPALAGKIEVSSATDLVGVAAEASIVERASANMVVLNVFKADDAPILDAHVNLAKCRNTGLEGRIGARYHKAGGWWEELDHLPATPLEVEAEVKKAKKAGAAAPPSEARTQLNGARATEAQGLRREAIIGALRSAGRAGLTLRDLRKTKGSGSPARCRDTLEELKAAGRARLDAGRWTLIL